MRLFENEQAQPVALFFALTQKYGHDWLEWEPFPLRRSVEQDFGFPLSEVNTAKAMAVSTLAIQNSFWEEWNVFHFITQALNGQPPVSHSLQEHTVGQMMAAVDDAHYLREHLKEVVPHPGFSDGVARYVAAQALAQGIWWMPAPLSFANDHASGRSYRCLDCGNESEIVFADNYCDVCVGRYDTSSLAEWVPDPEVVAKGYGKRTEVFYRNPPALVEARFNQLATVASPSLKEDQVDTCVSQLLYAQKYMDKRRELRTQQLAAL